MKNAAMAAQASPPRLAFFQSDVLGLARICDKFAATGPLANRNFYHSRVVDLWSLFPCFCKSPVDIGAAMPSLTTTLGRALDDKRYPELLVRFFGKSLGSSKYSSIQLLTYYMLLCDDLYKDDYLPWADHPREGHGAKW